MISLFLFFFFILLSGYFYFFCQTTLGDKLGIKKSGTIKTYREIPILSNLNYFKSLSDTATKNGVNIPASQLAVSALIATGPGFAVSIIVFQSLFFAVVAAGILFFGIPKAYMWHMTNSQRDKIFMQLSGALLSMTSALRAGKTLVDAIGTAAGDTPAPLGPELKKVFDAVRYGGEELSSALDKMLIRTGDHYIVRKLVLAITVTRQTGGNIASALDGVSDMIDNEKYTQEFAKSHSSHGRMVAVVFNLIILTVAGNMTRIMPGAFSEFFFSDFQGRLILFSCIVTVISSWIVIHRMLSTIFDI